MSRSISKRLRFQVLERDGFRCVYCGATSQETKLHVDHRRAYSTGGETSSDNLVTACQDCNLGKSDKRVADPPILAMGLDDVQIHMLGTQYLLDRHAGWFADNPEAGFLVLFDALCVLHRLFTFANDVISARHRQRWSGARSKMQRAMRLICLGNVNDSGKEFAVAADLLSAAFEDGHLILSGLVPHRGAGILAWQDADSETRLKMWADLMGKFGDWPEIAPRREDHP